VGVTMMIVYSYFHSGHSGEKGKEAGVRHDRQRV
jgi:hypothetical protein